jgi:hypothetical protein
MRWTLPCRGTRNRTFQPQIVCKGQTRQDGFNKQIIALYTRGITTGGIRARAAKHETRQHTLGGMSGVGKPAPDLQIAQICAHHCWIGIRLMSAPNGGTARGCRGGGDHALQLQTSALPPPPAVHEGFPATDALGRTRSKLGLSRQSRRSS